MVSLPTHFKRQPCSASPNSTRTPTASERPTPSENSNDNLAQAPLADNEEAWEVIGDRSQSEKGAISSPAVGLEVHTLLDPNGVLVSVRPPKNPPASLGGKKRHPVDIVLILDISSSMDSPVRVPKVPTPQSEGESDVSSKDGSIQEQESYHTRLDLAKNAVRGVVAGLDGRDRVGIVAFGYDATVFQELTRMTKEAQEALLTRIDTIEAYGATNLWGGLRQGYRMLASADKRPTTGLPDHSLSAIYLLTDGLPNVMQPGEGYVPALRRLIAKEVEGGKNPVIPSLHTFGFGYDLRSGLLQAIAEVGNGYYAFIPEGGFVATIFNHAFANLNITFSTSTKLRVSVSCCPEALSPLQGAAVSREEKGTLEVSLYNLQYGQQRDIFLAWPKGFDPTRHSSAAIFTSLEYTEPGRASQHVVAVRNASDISKSLAPALAYYHLHRSLVCEFLTSISKPNSVGEYIHIAPSELDSVLSKLEGLMKRIKTSGYEDELNTSILKDLKSDMEHAHRDVEDPAGQIHKALSKEDWFNKWGMHYLPSVLHAYRNQLCLNEKDPGPKMYVADNPLFEHFKQLQSDAWDTIEIRLAKLLLEHAEAAEKQRAGAISNSSNNNNNNNNNSSSSSGNQPLTGHYVLPPSYSYAASRTTMPAVGRRSTTAGPRVSMAVYNNPDNPCFAAPSRILLATTTTTTTTTGRGRTIPVHRLRAGALVATLAGPRRVAAVVKTSAARGARLCRLGAGLLVTPWHPVLLDGEAGGTWAFPAEVVAGTGVEVWRGRGVDVYSVLLESGGGGGEPGAHAVCVGGWWCVTLGHGVVERSAADVRGHEFFGDYGRVVRELKKLPKGRGGVLRCGGIKRDGTSGLACGFEKPVGRGADKVRKGRSRALRLMGTGSGRS